MSTPIGHALVGTGVASVVARLCGIRNSPRLLVGVAIASNLPDFDWILVLLGFPTKRVHRAATHSLVSLTALITLAILIVRQYSVPVDRRAIGSLGGCPDQSSVVGSRNHPIARRCERFWTPLILADLFSPLGGATGGFSDARSPGLPLARSAFAGGSQRSDPAREPGRGAVSGRTTIRQLNQVVRTRLLIFA